MRRGRVKIRSRILGATALGALLFASAQARAAATVSIDASVQTGTVSDKLFGVSIHWSSEDNGFYGEPKTQTEYEQVMANWHRYAALMDEMGVTAMRYPGGLIYSERFNWKKSIGPYASRKPLVNNKILGSIEALPNNVDEGQFAFSGDKKIAIGVDEFLRLVEDLGATAILTTPIGLDGSVASYGPGLNTNGQDCYRPDPDPAYSIGCPGDLADWVEYVNAPNDGSNPKWCGGAGQLACPSGFVNVDWAAKRAANGHPEPYGVKYWELGVETRLFQAGGLNGWNDYGKKFAIRARAMKAIDPAIQVGAVGCDALLEEPAKFKPWTQNVRSVVEANGAAIDFWQLHQYPPGSSPLMKGVDLQADGAYVEVKHDFQATDTYDFEMYATGAWSGLFPPSGGTAGLRVSVDGVPVEWPAGSGTQVLPLGLRATSAATTLAANKRTFSLALPQGVHTIRVEKVSGTCQTDFLGKTTCASAEVHSFVFYSRRSDGFKKYLDLKDDPMVHYLAQSGAIGIGDLLRLHDNYVPAGKSPIPAFLTEFNAGYEEPSNVQTWLRTPGSDLRDAMALWTLYAKAVEKNLQVAVAHQLFEDNWYGLVEGVGQDDLFGDRGRPDPRRRPTFYVFKLLREHLKKTKVQAAVTTPSVAVSKTGGYKLGYGGAFTNNVPLVEAIATKSDDGCALHIALVNRDADNPQAVTVNVAGFGPVDPRGTLDLLWAEEFGANNEPEPLVCSNPELGCPEMVKTRRYALDGVGTSFVYQMPRHSMAAIVLRRSDADWTPPAGVQDAVTALFGGFIKVGWSPVPDADLAGYNVYRSTVGGGPYKLRVAQVGPGVTSWKDPKAPAGNDYRYAVAAFDAAGNEGPRSPTAEYDADLALAGYGLSCSAERGAGAGSPRGAALAAILCLAAPALFARALRRRGKGERAGAP